MLSEAHGEALLQLRRELVLVDDVYRTANGRLLLAYLAEADLQAFLRQRGLPGTAWEEVADEAGLRAALGQIRGAGCFFDVSPQQVARASFPVRQGERVVAALGLYAPEFRFRGQVRERALRRLAEAAEAISAGLNHVTGGSPPARTVVPAAEEPSS